MDQAPTVCDTPKTVLEYFSMMTFPSRLPFAPGQSSLTTETMYANDPVLILHILLCPDRLESSLNVHHLIHILVSVLDTGISGAGVGPHSLRYGTRCGAVGPGVELTLWSNLSK